MPALACGHGPLTLMPVTTLTGPGEVGVHHARSWGSDRVTWRIKTEVNSQQLEYTIALDIHLYWLNINTEGHIIIITLEKEVLTTKTVLNGSN